jgi:hypothetical protein
VRIGVDDVAILSREGMANLFDELEPVCAHAHDEPGPALLELWCPGPIARCPDVALMIITNDHGFYEAPCEQPFHVWVIRNVRGNCFDN